MRAGSSAPNILFRETIGHSAEGERKYIRYYDGRGHFGHVRLRLIPHPGASCSVSLDVACSLPDECCRAIQDSLMRRCDLEPRSHLRLIGLEAHVIGGASWIAIPTRRHMRSPPAWRLTTRCIGRVR